MFVGLTIAFVVVALAGFIAGVMPPIEPGLAGKVHFKSNFC